MTALRTNPALRLVSALLAYAGIASCGSGFGAATGPILGTWERKNTDGSVRDRWVFKADGTFTFDELSNPPAQQDHVSGRFGVSGQTLNGQGTNSKDGKSATMRVTYFANADKMCVGALLPQGSLNGVVGTWFGEQTSTVSDGTQVTTGIRVQVRGDQTATVTITGATAAAGAREATWEDKGGGVYKVRFGSGTITISQEYTLLDGKALCDTVYDRAS